MTSTTDTIPAHVILTEFDNHEGVLIDLAEKQYFQLNETALLIWRGLVAGQSPGEIIRDLTSRYELSEAQAAASLGRFRQQLEQYRLCRKVQA